MGMSSERTGAGYVIFYAALVLFFTLHLYYVTAPPNGYHVWRESDTAAVTLNYYQDAQPFLAPRTNELGSSSEKVRMELPFYNLLSSTGYYLHWPDHLAGHLVTVLAALAALWFLYGLAARLFDCLTAAMAVWAMAFSPLFFYYSYKLMPDILMFALWLGAVYCFVRYINDKVLWSLLLSALLLGLSACLKLLGLSVLPMLFFMLLRDRSGRLMKTVIMSVYAVLSLLPPLGWMVYSGWLSDRLGVAGSFLPYFFSPLFFKKIFLQWPFELWAGWVMVPALIYGAYYLINRKKAALILVWLFSSFIAIVLVARYSRHHDYYSLLFVPALALVSGYGLSRLFEHRGFRKIIAVVLLVLAPVGAFVRVADRFGETQEFRTIRAEVDKVIPAGSRIIVQDNTRGAVRLYQLNRKGWYIVSPDETDKIADCIRDGARFLVLQKPHENLPDKLKNIFSDCPGRVGPLYCYPLKSEK
ncbi:MAG: ArnT family glycosyltransferase [Candidatus Zixiibacteriota bacterium]